VADTETDVTSLDSDAEITLALLTAVESNAKLTQRSVAKELDIALGLTNSYLKRCIKKGWIKVTQAPANRYAYYLTPHGFAEKSRLTARYLAVSFNFFREARQQCGELFDLCAVRGWRRIVFCGKSDFVEIATLCAIDRPIELVGIVDALANDETYAGIPILQEFPAAGQIDAVIISDLNEPQATFDRVSRLLPEERVLGPRFANISRRQRQLAE